MTLVTLHGAIPVYVQVDTENQEVVYVCASDEEFFYVGGRVDHETSHMPIALAEPGKTSLPLAYDPNGERLTDNDLITHAVAIAQNDSQVVGDKFVSWPGWSWGW